MSYFSGGLCLQNSLLVHWHGFCLLLGLSVSWLVFVCSGFFGSWGLRLVLGLCVCGLVSM